MDPDSPCSSEADLRAEIAELKARLNGTKDGTQAVSSSAVQMRGLEEDARPPGLSALQDSERETNRLRSAILEKVSDAIVAIDEDRRVLYINAAAEQRYGVIAANVMGQPLTALYQNRWQSLDDETRAWSALTTHGQWRGKTMHVKLDGTELHVETSVSRLTTPEGRPAGMLGVIRDITSQIEAERAVQESSTRLRDALAAANLGIWNLDTRTGKFTSDDRYKAIFGCAVNGLSAEEALSNLHADDISWVTAAVEAATRPIDPVPYDVEYRVRHPDGSIRWVAAKGSARFIETSQGRELAGFEGTVADITERKRAELNARFLANVSEDLATLTEVAAIMETVGAKLGMHLGLSLCNFVDVNEAADETVVTYAWHRPDVPSSIGRYKLSEYLSTEFQTTLRSGEPFVVCNTSVDPRTNAAAYAALKMGAFACMPLVREGRWCFMLNIHHSVPHDWSAEEIALVRELTARVWTRLERVRIETALRASEARLASEAQALLNLNKVSSRLWQSLDLSSGLQEMLQATIDMLGADMGNVQVMNPAGVLIIGAQRGFQRDFLERFREVAPEKDSVCERALRLGERLVIEDAESDARYIQYRDVARESGYRAVQSTPLVSRSGVPLGMISTHWRTPHVPSAHALRRLDLYARQAADFIERSQNDEALRQTRQRFDIVKDSTQVGFWFCDLPFDKLVWDDRVKEHFWLPPDANVTIHTFYERMHPADREPTRRAVETSITNKTRYEIEYRTVSPDNDVKWIRAIGRGFYDGDGQPNRFDGVTLDITERKRADALLQASEAQLREGRERLQAALNGSGAGTFRWNIQTNALEWDENLDRLFGLRPGQTIRSLEKFIDVIHPAERPGVIERCRLCATEGADFDMEFRIIWPDGSVHWLLDQGATFRDATGQPLYMTGMCLDITKSKQTEETLRTAKERAEAASRSKDDFLAALSHELRTPLTPVLLTAAALKEDPRLPDEIREQLGMMERNIALEARLIDDLLDITAISHGKLQMRLERCDLKLLVDQATAMVSQDALAKNLAILTEFNAGLVVMADHTRLQQVVWNLLRNAVKFTPPRGKISIRTRENFSPDGKPWLTLEIADTGIGIEAAYLKQIFQPFDQGALAGNHRFGGLGLGLAIAQAVVVAHGGQIQAQSNGSGQGATFCVNLPHALGASPLAKQILSGPPTLPSKKASLRILLVEDHESTLQTLARLLQRDGHRVMTATTITRARTTAAENSFDLVISDLGLPDGSGIQLMESLRSSHGLRGIALSGYGMEDDIARSRAAGFVAHLVKPVAISDLRRALENISSA